MFFIDNLQFQKNRKPLNKTLILELERKSAVELVHLPPSANTLQGHPLQSGRVADVGHRQEGVVHEQGARETVWS